MINVIKHKTLICYTKPQCYKQNCQNRNTYSEHISPTLQLILLELFNVTQVMLIMKHETAN